MVTVIVRVKAIEERRKEFLTLVSEFVEKTRKEEGCTAHEFLQDVNNKNNFVFVEKWVDEEAVNRHNNSDHFVRIIGQLRNLEEKEPEINMFNAANMI